jgi:molecular chaperone HtpG
MKREGQIKVHSENILPIIKKWLYSDKDIFLRELVSNGCDAIKKYEKLKNIGEVTSDEEKLYINVVIDKEKRTIKIEDNGIGMTEDEVEKYITQVAFSGAEEFIERYKDKTDGEAGIIGHFGLGFYSAFMVSDTVEIDTLSFVEGAKPVHWASTGASSYSIGDGERTTRGTTIILNIAENESEFLEEGRISGILKKYCAFMQYEIFLGPMDGEEQKPFNNTNPLWLKAPKDCTNEEYEQFYREVFFDFNPPLFWIHLNVNFPFNLKGILYFPKQTNKVEIMPGEIKLYSNQVYVADNIKEVVPEFLMLLKGVIDCPDLPLNVSRSFLQNDGDLEKISKHISKKVSDKLHAIFNEEKENYIKYWDDISPFIKFGCLKDEKFYDSVKDILILRTINGEYLTLSEYPKEADGKIFYVSNENLQSQYVRMFKENGLNAAILTHMIDSHFISFIEYKEKELKFARIDSDIGNAMKNEEEAENQEQLIEKFKNSLENSELIVKAEQLKSAETPAIMLLSEQSRRMQDMSAIYGEAFAGMKPETTIVLNTANDIVKRVPELPEENAKLVCQHIYDLAMISHKPLTADEMAGFIERSVKILKIITSK